MRFPSFSALLALLVLACGGSPPPAAPPSAAPPAAGAAAVPRGADGGASTAATDAKPAADSPKFDDLPNDKKVELMMTKVKPNVGKVFKEHDGKKYANFGCATCH